MHVCVSSKRNKRNERKWLHKVVLQKDNILQRIEDIIKIFY